MLNYWREGINKNRVTTKKDIILYIIDLPWTNNRHSEVMPASAICAWVILTDVAREFDTDAEYTEI